MNKSIINIQDWPRRELFNHYYNTCPCRYSMTVDLDITNFINKKLKIYPTMLYSLAKVVNSMDEFKFNIVDGQVVLYDILSPAYTIFNEKTQLFSDIWSEYNNDYYEFLVNYNNDVEKYGNSDIFFAKGLLPGNIFPVSMIPWIEYKDFNINMKYGNDFLTPIFTIGRYINKEEKVLIPLSIDVHHAVCDGYHICKFIKLLQKTINGL